MLGSFSFEDMQKAYSENPPEDAPKIEHIDGVFTEMGLEAVKELNHTIKMALADTNSIENIFKEKVGLTNYPDLAGLTTVLKDIDNILFKKIQQQEPEIDHAELEKKDIDISIADNNLSQTTIPFNPGEINNRKDVVKAIEKICKYYRKNEPGSPIPLLLERTKRLVDKEFIEILEDLSPDGVGQARSILGVIDKE
jgi:type VI secretion system protein ImpA